MRIPINKSILAFALMSVIAISANAQLAAPFAGGVKLQQGGGVNPQFGIGMKATPGFTGNFVLNWAQPISNGVVKLSGFGAGAGDMVVTTLDLSSASDVGSSVLGVANGGTGTTTLLGALNALLPSQGGNNGKFLTTDGTNTSWGSAVTSVGLSLPAELTVSNSPVTTTGTLTAAWASQSANQIFASPDGAAGSPSFRAMTSTDVPNLDASKITTGTFTTSQIPNLDASKITTGTFTSSQIPNLDASKITTGTFTASQIPNLDASKITTGTLPVSRGGTGVGSLTGNGVLSSNALGDGLVSTHLNDGEIMIGSTAGAPVAATLTAGNGISITNAAGSITISGNANSNNKLRVGLLASAVSYATNAAPAGFTLSATSVINITVLEAGGYPITATVTNINTVGNTFDFVISGYPTAGSIALIQFQN
jgi:hypothetical protein